MRTLLFLLSGLLLAGLFRLLTRLFMPAHPPASGLLPLLFALLWFSLASANMALGIIRAGYSFAEELPIFLLIFAPPVALIFWPGGK
ncbi:hypothetical protein CD006_15295 [Enterobacter sp. 10-1]|uniref:hypothetical protein n=1 Tax=Raoultella sp. 10-1 TaxID=2683201 RepID=UPI000BA2D182|nr:MULTISPECIES: hypothetical protein [Enterobacteriaceae]MVT03981.1 hypothetical protein [Raoultella sp. 10-1]PAC11590.1 hypothetical protein CD006_15295 [Enterobacter sp. 10-1]